MKLIHVLLFFIFSAPSLVQAEEQKGKNILQKMNDVFSSAAPGASQKGSVEPVQYLSKKIYVRQKAEGANGWADVDCERKNDCFKLSSEGSKLGYVWDERFCLEGSFQFQPEGGANYGLQAVIRF